MTAKTGTEADSLTNPKYLIFDIININYEFVRLI